MRQFLLLGCLFLTVIASAQDSTDSRRFSILPLPALGYEPETRGYIGAVALFTTDFYHNDSTRISNGFWELNYTQNRQWVLTLNYDHYFRNDEHILTTSFNYLYFPEYFYGIGNETAADDRLLMESQRLEWFVGIEQRIWKRLFAGVHADGQSMWQIEFENSNIPDRDRLLGLNNPLSSGFGYGLRWDSRNSVLNPKSGSFAQIQHTLYQEILFSEFDFNRLLIDFRQYKTFWKDRMTLAAQLYSELNSGDVPFRMLALMGSSGVMRGYYRGRYRDDALMAGQIELRSKLFWRIGLTGFAGMGRVGDQLSDFGSDYHPSLGGGFRIRFDDVEDINMRFDVAYNPEGSTFFYIAFGEAF